MASGPSRQRWTTLICYCMAVILSICGCGRLALLPQNPVLLYGQPFCQVQGVRYRDWKRAPLRRIRGPILNVKGYAAKIETS